MDYFRKISLTTFACALSWAWWIYLSITAHPLIAQDALGYESVAHHLVQDGFYPSYFIQGPGREPIYLLLVAAAMKIGNCLNMPYTMITNFFGFMILVSNQCCCWYLLKKLKIQQPVIAACLFYLGFSPAINNSAFSLYSEIAAIALILPLFICIHHWLETISTGKRHALLLSLITGLLFICLCFVKASLEVIAPIIIGILFIIMVQHYPKHKFLALVSCLICLGSFLIGIHGYKDLNYHYNGHYAITNRASWALYGNTTRRMEPLNQERLLSAIAYAPGEGICKIFFKPDACDFWSFKRSDELGMLKENQLTSLNLSPAQIDRYLIHDAATLALSNPVQYTFLTLLESVKMFFWESTQIGFVTYPSQVSLFYNNTFIKNSLRLVVGLISAVSLLFLWISIIRKKANPLITIIGLYCFFFILTYAFFFILTRYALPIAPLFLIAIAYFGNFLYNNRHAEHQRHS